MAKKASIIQRLNYGVVFKDVGMLDAAEQAWKHTFQIQLPSIRLNNNSPPAVCRENSSECRQISDIVYEIYSIQEDMAYRVNNVTAVINDIVPLSRHAQPSTKSRRGILNFVGDLSKQLFGTATNKDLDVLAEHVAAMVQETSQLQHAFQQHSTGMESYMTSVNKRLDNTMHSIELNHDQINEVSHYMSRALIKTRDTWLSLLRSLTNTIHHSHIIELEINELLTGVYSLVQGKLSPFLIPFKTLQNALYNVNAKVQTKFPGFEVTIVDPNYYYQSPNIRFSQHENMLYINIDITVSSSNKLFNIYQVLSLPVPLNHTTSHASQLLDLQPYVAIEFTTGSSIQMSESLYQSCRGNKQKHCNSLLAETPSNSFTCISAIFFQRSQIIQNLCNFRVIENGTKPMLLELEPGLALASNIADIVLSCTHDIVKRLPGCMMCVFQIPCQCSVSTQKFHIASRIHRCIQNQDAITQLHPVNLALLQQFFSQTDLNKIKPDTLFDTPLNFTIPSFQFYEHDFHHRVASDQTLHLSLKHIAEDAKVNNTIYRSLSEPMLSQIWTPQAQVSWLSGLAYLTYVTTALSIALTVISFKLYTKLKVLSLAITTLQQIKATNAIKSSDIQNLVWTKPTVAAMTTSTQLNSLSGLITEPQLATIIICIGIIIITTVLVLALYFGCNRGHKHATLNLVVTNGVKCTNITLFNLSECPVYWQVQPEIKLQAIHIKWGLLKAQILLDWSKATIAGRLANKTIAFPTEIQVSKFKGQALQKCLNTEYICYLAFTHNGYTQPIAHNLEQTNRETMITPTAPEHTNIPKTASEHTNIPKTLIVKMYPDLEDSKLSW